MNQKNITERKAAIIIILYIIFISKNAKRNRKRDKVGNGHARDHIRQEFMTVVTETENLLFCYF